MCRNELRIQSHVVAMALPQVPFASQQVVDLVGMVRRKAQFLDRQFHPTRLRMVGVEVHHDQNRVLPVFALPAVAQQLVVVDRMKAQVAVALQGRILARGSD